jgi:hypothetical protein
MQDILTYWRRVFVLAMRHSLDLTQSVIFVLLIVAGVASYFVPKAAPLEAVMTGWNIRLGRDCFGAPAHGSLLA